jgi:predicted DNA-binding transcriptional regulator AlpA
LIYFLDVPSPRKPGFCRPEAEMIVAQCRWRGLAAMFPLAIRC